MIIIFVGGGDKTGLNVCHRMRGGGGGGMGVVVNIWIYIRLPGWGAKDGVRTITKMIGCILYWDNSLGFLTTCVCLFVCLCVVSMYDCLFVCLFACMFVRSDLF